MLKIYFSFIGLVVSLLSLNGIIKDKGLDVAYATRDKNGNLIQDQNCWSLKYGPMFLRIDTSVGARIVSFKWNDEEFLTQKSTEPDYFGATLWPDPQNKWWPVDSALDGKPYSIIQKDQLNIFLSGKQSQSGLRFEKFFSINPRDSSLHIVYTINNSGDTAVSVGPWELIRTNEGLVFYPGKESSSLPKSDLTGVNVKNQMVWYFHRGVKAQGQGKLFSYTLANWMACATNKLIFIKTFPLVKPGEVAPGQGSAEIYTNTKETYVELETHGKYTKLQPGNFIKYEVTWYLRSLPGKQLSKSDRHVLIRYVEQFLEQHKGSKK